MGRVMKNCASFIFSFSGVRRLAAALTPAACCRRPQSHKRPRRQTEITIMKNGPPANGAGSGIDLIVEKVEVPFALKCIFIRKRHTNSESIRSRGEMLERALIGLERRIDRIERD